MSAQKYLPVRDVMTSDIEMIDGMTPVADALERLRRKQISSLIVERREDGDEYGMLTVGDIARGVLVPNLSAERVSAYEIMTKPVLSVDAGMNIRYAIRLLTRFSVSRALVLDAGKAVGIVTLRDMVLRSAEFQ